MTTTATQTRILAITDGGPSPGWRRVDWTDLDEQEVHVCEIASGLISVAVDEDDEECDPDHANRDVSDAYAEQIVCMRSPHKKTPPHADPIAAIRNAIARGRYRVAPGVRYVLDGEDITSQLI